jgi:Cof subfamily protein (haloacid dehalogenase superfamily)
MMEAKDLPRFKLAAIDLDGTLLGADHRISEANHRAVRQLQAAGIQVVLASGRHYNSMRDFADALAGVQWLVSCQGGEVSSADRTTVLDREFLGAAAAGQTLELGKTFGFTTLAYAVEGVFTDGGGNAEMDFYTELAGHRPVRVSPAEMSKREVFKVIWVGDPAQLSRLPSPVPRLPPQVQSVRTNARFLEFMPAHVSKRSALERLAARLNIKPAQAVAFGDGENDVPMFEWAGVSVAMPQGWPAAIRAASMVAPAGPSETALARGVDLILKSGS